MALLDYDCAFMPPDPLTGCRKPRSCSACLQKPGCTIGIYGGCQAYYDVQLGNGDFTTAIARNLTLPGALNNASINLNNTQYWSFPALQTSYCPSTDPVCSKCIEERFWVSPAYPTDSRFCVGSTGCVCISNCEFGDTISASCPDSSYSTEAPTDYPTVTPAPTQPPNSFLACRFLEPNISTGCRKARPCNQCLQQPGCRIGVDGFCELDTGDLDTYQNRSYLLAFDLNWTLPPTNSSDIGGLSRSHYWYFAAKNATYCTSDDAVCRQCQREAFWLNPHQPPDSRFCVGDRGCVCIANCVRSDDYDWCVNNNGSNSTTDYGNDSADRIRSLEGTLSILVTCVIALALCCLSWYCYRCIQKNRRRQAASQSEQPPVPTAQRVQPQPDREPVLELYGWRSHRQLLIDNETRRLNGYDDLSTEYARL